MATGVYKVEYQIDGKEKALASISEEGIYYFPVPPTINGYVVVGIWVYDYALNVTYDTYWYWLQGGHIKSVQLVNDGRFRLNLLKDHSTIRPIPHIMPLRQILAGYKMKLKPVLYQLRKLKDQRRV